MTSRSDAKDPLIEIRDILIGSSLDELRERFTELRARVEDESRSRREDGDQVRGTISHLGQGLAALETSIEANSRRAGEALARLEEQQASLADRLARLERAALSREDARRLFEDAAAKLEDEV